MGRAFALALLVYVTLDFADPNLPGALNFDLTQSVDGVQTQGRPQLPVMKDINVRAPLTVANADDAATRPAPRAVSAVVRRPLVEVRPRAVLSRALPPDSSETH